MKLKILVSLIAAICCPDLYAAEENKRADFDVNILKARGLSPEVAEFFKTEKRFTAGVNYVTLLVNGVKFGITDAQFDDAGQLCVTPALLAFAQVGLPEGAVVDEAAPAACVDLLQHYPQAVVRLRPGIDQVELLLPPDALRHAVARSAAAGVATGGSAALLNYDIIDSRSRYAGGSSRTLQAMTEAGLNSHDWILRSRQSYSDSGSGRQFKNVNAYAQTTFADQKLVLQVGQINPASALFSTPGLVGAQLLPEGALLQQGGAGVSASGIAQSEARVEVRQKTTLIYSTLVPPGPFTLNQLPIVDSHADLHVKVIESGGEERTFIVPAAGFNLGFSQTEQSVSFAMGRPERSGLRNADGSSADSDWLATVNASRPLGARANLNAGALLTSNYHGVGFSISAAPSRASSINVSNVWSHQGRSGWVGTQLQLNGSAQLLPDLSVTGSVQQRTKKFRNVGEPSGPVAVADGFVEAIGFKQQQTASLSYQLGSFGALGFGYSKYINFDKSSSERVVASWSKNIGKASLNLSVEHGGGQRDNLLYLSLNVPLGRRSVSASSSRQGERLQHRLSVSERVNEFGGYSASASTDSSRRDVSTSLSANVLPKYAQLSFGASAQGGRVSSFSSSMSGGVLLHQAGLTLSPYPLQDTFALIAVPGVSGARVNTTQGPVWTDFRGHAVAPSMPAYSEGRLELVTKSLPRSTDVKSGIRTVRMGRGAVMKVGFDIVQTRRALLRLLYENGKPVEKGTAIFDGSTTWITSVGSDGSIFLNDSQLAASLQATNAAGKSCGFDYQFPDKIDPDALYETADVVCR